METGSEYFKLQLEQGGVCGVLKKANWKVKSRNDPIIQIFLN